MVANIIEHFKDLPDPRRNQHLKLHKLIDIVVIAGCATVAQQDTWEEIADYAGMKQNFLKQFLELPNGIPSHDTLNRVFSL
jgi:DDE_Tnp_1-associated